MPTFSTIDVCVDLGILGAVPLCLSFQAHDGRLEIAEIALRSAAGVRPLPQLDLLADALGLRLDAVLLAGATAPSEPLTRADGV
ncbi:hypothetical protein [Teichococcus aestuarii]|uniref:Uncharacterized protein n=1 Tax=Teichococcus aestuarii TaxID=568898 RepID=A0A2U1UXJ3_9PROT|nr:hypothetical protein [Pseudoroseomonas aestuarii]PWC26395.1 hypothetical protein CR165_23460 [Pseudoroseomonas aestuarii]